MKNSVQITNQFNKNEEWKQKIIKGLELAYAKMLEFKKQNKSDLVIMKDGKVVRIPMR
ncbi:MAG: hypothetical protein WBP00_07210 [Saprospiraceae bacterium]